MGMPRDFEAKDLFGVASEGWPWLADAEGIYRPKIVLKPAEHGGCNHALPVSTRSLADKYLSIQMLKAFGV